MNNNNKVKFSPAAFVGEMSDETIKKIVQSIITNQMALDLNNEVKHTKYYKHKLKNALTLANKELLKVEKDFEHFIDSDVEKPTDDVYNVQYQLIRLLTSFNVLVYGSFIHMIEAYRLDPNGMIEKANMIKADNDYGTKS